MPGDWKTSVGVALLRILPTGALSHLAGWLASLPLPPRLRVPVYRLFGNAVGVDFSEIRDPLPEYPSLQAFFTRALRSGAREWETDSRALVAPCDGTWGQAGRVERGLLIQVKGRPYRLADLIEDEGLAARMEGGYYATFYLSPRDYHRFHTPCAVRVLRAVHIPGSLWPVNRIGVNGIRNLYARNERIVAQMRYGESRAENSGATADLCMVAVGATLVGKIRLTFDDLTTHNSAGESIRHDYAGDAIGLPRGAEWGHFEFGSTIVLVAVPGGLELELRPAGTPLRLGERIGRLLDSSDL